jgi:biopolymer transport protein ExbB/biopolymer transport protein TolQ
MSLVGTKALGLLFFLQDQGAGGAAPAQNATANAFTMSEMIKNLGPVAIGVIAILLIMSMYSIAVMVERFLTYRAAKTQSREFAPRVAQALKNDRIEEAINISDKHKKSHLAMVVNAGLQEFRAHEAGGDISGDEIEASKRALQRAIAIKSAEFRRGLSGLATIGSTAPFVGLFGTVFGIISAFTGVKYVEFMGVAAVAGGLAEALLTTALGVGVAVPAVWVYNYFSNRAAEHLLELDNAAAQALNCLQRQKHAR